MEMSGSSGNFVSVCSDDVLNYDNVTQFDEAVRESVNEDDDTGSEGDDLAEVEMINLAGVSVKDEKEAYDLYNEYAMKVGFSVRKGKARYSAGANKIIVMKRYLCSKEGKKQDDKRAKNSFTKLDTRTGCGAMVQFNVCVGQDCWTVTKHIIEHNHDLCPESQRYLMRSQRGLNQKQVEYLLELKRSGVPVSTGIRLIKNQGGGSPNVGFTARDAYNKLGEVKSFQLYGGDARLLIEIFKKRKEEEEDFYFDFELDSDSRLCSLFWRDGGMKKHYERFGDLVVHDTTYRTNKYDMICAPFVGMNHHGQNVMFGCGFLGNERTESFVWLFETFLKSMNGKHPVTVMTDQCAAMAAGIRDVFPNSRHRLCTWHILENSKKNIPGLRSREGFVDMFDHVLMRTTTIAEFEFCWSMLMEKYGCREDAWLKRLYKLKVKWCSSYNKDCFSGGILSSQRSESTNHAVSRKLRKTAGLCDFYHCFSDVVCHWRSAEKAEDNRCITGLPEVIIKACMLLQAREVYTIAIYKLFEAEFMKSFTLQQEVLSSSENISIYNVWGKINDTVIQQVEYGKESEVVCCTCKMYTEVGILCRHCVRVMIFENVLYIPETYINNRWRKCAIVSTSTSENSSESHGGENVWQSWMSKKFLDMVADGKGNKRDQELIETGYKNIMEMLVEKKDSDEEGLCDGNVKNPLGSREKGVRNKRKKSILEIKVAQARSKKKNEKKDKERINPFKDSAYFYCNVQSSSNVVQSNGS